MKKLLYFFLPLLALVACTEGGVDNNSDPQPQPEAKIPINISTSIMRANDTEFENDDKIGIYVVNQPGALASSGNHVDNVCFTYSGGWTPDSEIYWKDQTTKTDFYAYYPYSATVNTSAHSFAVRADQSEEADYWASDFLWGKKVNVTPTATAVPITVNHLLSNILVYIKAGEGFTDESLAASNISVKINNVKTSASIDLASGVATAEGEAITVTPWNTGEYYRAMVVPQTVAEGTAFVTVTVDNAEYTFTSGLTLLANKQHKILLTIDKTVGGVDVGIGKWDVVEENFEGNPDITTTAAEIRVTATCEEATLKTHVYSVFQDAVESFTNEDGVYVIKLKEGYTDIPDGAFDGSEYGLTNVIIGNGIASIGKGAFRSCDAMTSVTIPESVTSIGERAFSGCTSMAAFYGKFATSDNCCLIVDGALRAFAKCSGKTVYVIPDGVTEIGDYVFSGCTSLTSVTIPDSVTSIGFSAFSDCTSLTSVNIPDGVTSIGDNVFYNCTSLTSVTIPDSVISIGFYAFSGCTELTNANIPDGVISIGWGIFYGCTSLTNVTIPDGVTEIGTSAFAYCHSLTSVTIPNSVTLIGWETFANCTSLINVTIPDSVKTIENSAFEGCGNLTKVVIGSGVKTIQHSAFKNCYSLNEIICKPTTPPAVTLINNTWEAFKAIGSSAKIYAPTESIDAYKKANGWKDYADIIFGYDFNE